MIISAVRGRRSVSTGVTGRCNSHVNAVTCVQHGLCSAQCFSPASSGPGRLASPTGHAEQVRREACSCSCSPGPCRGLRHPHPGLHGCQQEAEVPAQGNKCEKRPTAEPGGSSVASHPRACWRPHAGGRPPRLRRPAHCPARPGSRRLAGRPPLTADDEKKLRHRRRHTCAHTYTRTVSAKQFTACQIRFLTFK